MITYEEAYEKAKALKPNIDACDEYDKGYLFKAEAERFMIGGDGACIILKEDGRAVNQTEFYESVKPTFIQKIDVEKK